MNLIIRLKKRISYCFSVSIFVIPKIFETSYYKGDTYQSQHIACFNCKCTADVVEVPNINYSHDVFVRKREAYRGTYRKVEQKNYLFEDLSFTKVAIKR